MEQRNGQNPPQRFDKYDDDHCHHCHYYYGHDKSGWFFTGENPSSTDFPVATQWTATKMNHSEFSSDDDDDDDDDDDNIMFGDHWLKISKSREQN